ncbi:MAG: hypothetical protein HY319_29125 [Armatimonadetes bacterium]|nr:hypothetical protein [Armatimonadota bacterium]
MIVAAPCPMCEKGRIGFRLCSSKVLALLCDECGYVWTHPSRLEARYAEDPLDPEFARRHPDLSLRSARWATREEIERQSWGVYLLKPEDLTHREE